MASIEVRGYRAFDVVSHLEPKQRLFLVTNDMHEPHLREGEWAVVDLDDREIQWGELFLIRRKQHMHVWQIRPAQPAAAPKDSAWLCPLNTPATTAEARFRTAAGDTLWLPQGPVSLASLRQWIVGRLVALYQLESPLGAR